MRSHRGFRTSVKSLLRSSFFPRRIVLALTLSTLGAVSASAFAQDPSTARVSVADDESQANGGSHSVDISGDGRYITFGSSASNLVSGGTGIFDVYVRDHTLGTTELISQSTSGDAGNSTSGWPSISRDGRYVAFMSIASTLVSDDDNANADVFLHDRNTGTTSLISREIDGTPGAGRSEKPEISADGMHVAFVSTAANLVNGVTGNHTYVYHVVTDTIELISQGSGEVPGNGSSSHDFPSISDDGRYVVFRSTSSNFGPDPSIPTNAGIFLRNTVNGTTARVGAGFSVRDPAISGNGTWISFRLGGFTILGTERSSLTPIGGDILFTITSFAGAFEQLRWSADGRFLVFFEEEARFSPSRPRVYDRVKDNFIEVAITHDGNPIDRGGAAPNTFGAAGISDNGRFVAFWAEGTTIVLGDTNGVEDVFLRDIGDILPPNVIGLRADPSIVNVSTPVVISATIDDAGRGDSVIVSADISLDGGGFQPLSPEDGSFDSPAELVSKSYVGLSGGMHQACVRGTDEFGNTGTFSDCVSFEVTVEGWPLTVEILSIEDLNGGFPADDPVYVRALVSTLLIPTDLVDNSDGRIVPNGSSIDPPWEYMGVALSDQDPAIVILEVWAKKPFTDEKLDAAPDNDQVIFSVDLVTGELSDFPYGLVRCSKGDTPGRAVRICYKIELSRDLDPDGDAIPSVWEVNGLDVDGDGVVDVDLAAMGADPMRKDLFVEIDCLYSDGNSDGDFDDPEDHDHCPLQSALDSIVAVFANAPLDNPDGTTGIQIHLDVGTLYGAGPPVTVGGFGGVSGTYGDYGGGGDKIPEAGNEVVVFEPIDDYIDSTNGQKIINANPPFTRFGDLKAVYFNDARRPVFRYSLWAHQTALRKFNRDDCTSGLAERVPSDGLPTPGRIADDHLVTLGGRKTDKDGNGLGDLPCWSTGPLNNIDDDGDGKVDEDPEDGIDNDGDCVAGTDTNKDGIACGVGDIGVDEDGGFSIGDTKEQAGIFIHEFAHNLGLAHGGIDETNQKPNHRSVLNYAGIKAMFDDTATFCNVTTSAGGPETCDLSREKLPTLDENSFDECLGFDSGKFNGLGPINVNKINGLQGDSCDTGLPNIPWNLNGDKAGKLTELSGSDDWANINFGYSHREAAYGVSVFGGGFTPEDLEAAAAHLESMSRAQVDVGLPSGLTVVEGEPVQFDVQLASTGQGPALQIEITSNGFAGSPISDLTDILQLDQSTSITLDLGIAPQMPGIHVIPIRISYASLSGKLTELALETSVTVLSSNLPPTINIGEDPLILEGNTLGGWSGDLTLVAGVTASDPDGDPVTLINDAPSFFPLGDTTVTWTATDTSGNTTTGTQQVTVVDTTPPVLTVPPDVTAEANAVLSTVDIGTATATDIFLESVTNDAPALFPLGTTIVMWTATDTSGNTTTDTQQVTVIDTTAPELSLSVSPTMLWPPNHKMIPIGLTATASDVGDPNPIVELVIVQSSEGDNIDTFDLAFDVTEVVGKKGNDIQLVDGQLFLRAERSGNSDGRVYSINYQATDASGNSTSATVTVEVPHNQ